MIAYRETFERSADVAASKQKAFSVIKGVLPKELTEACFDSYLKTNKPEIDRIISNIKDSFDSYIQAVSWMPPDIQGIERKRLSEAEVLINMPKFNQELSSKELNVNDPVANLKLISTYHYRQIYTERVGKDKDPLSVWKGLGNIFGTVCIVYEDNKVFMPLSWLVNTEFKTSNLASNYGYLGSQLGHELAHSFEPRRNEDYWGDMREALANNQRSIERYGAIAKALEQQYLKYTYSMSAVEVPKDIAAKEFEDMSDNIGLKVAYDAYTKLLLSSGVRMDTKEWKDNMQRFYRGFADWVHNGYGGSCHDIKHSGSEIRINGTVKNQDGFHQAFGVKQGDKMYLEPGNRIDIQNFRFK